MALVIGCSYGAAAAVVPPSPQAVAPPSPQAGNHPSPHAGDRAPPAAPGPSPGSGAQADAQNHLLEAQWSEVVVKAQKHGKSVTAAIKLVSPKIRLFHAAPVAETDDQKAAKNAKKPEPNDAPTELIDLTEQLHKITPLEVDHIDILNGQVAFIDTSRPEHPELWIHDLELSVENLTTRLHLSEGRPALLTATGTLARSGKVSIFITAEPFESGLTFSGRAAVVGLQTAELYRFIEPTTKLQAPQGTVDIFVEFDCRNGELTGGIKPVLKNVKIRSTRKNPFIIIKAWAADMAVKIFSDRVSQRNAVATVIPIKGTLKGPKILVWPTIFGVMRNAFIAGLTSGYADLPPPDKTAPPPDGDANPPTPEPTP
ncbi:MAG: hypothetical protein JWM82_2835 [Myxococcales bacterium]|nr:hypothetical protein [Myxococcales bacterium]